MIPGAQNFGGAVGQILENFGSQIFGVRGVRGVRSHECNTDRAPLLPRTARTFWTISWPNYDSLKIRPKTSGSLWGQKSRVTPVRSLNGFSTIKSGYSTVEELIFTCQKFLKLENRVSKFHRRNCQKLPKNSILHNFFVRGPKGRIFTACDRDPTLNNRADVGRFGPTPWDFFGRFSENRKYRGSLWGAVASKPNLWHIVFIRL